RDRATWALVVTDRAAGTPVQVVPIAAPRAELDDRLFRARGVAAIALEAIAARQASLRFILGGVGVQSPNDLVKRRAPGVEVDRALPPPTRLGVIPDAEHLERREIVLGLYMDVRAAEPCVNRA